MSGMDDEDSAAAQSKHCIIMLDTVRSTWFRYINVICDGARVSDESHPTPMPSPPSKALSIVRSII